MPCTCDASDQAHHHAFGGVYDCQGRGECGRCQEADEVLWRDQLSPASKPRVVRPVRDQPGREAVRRRYGSQTADILYGRSPRPGTD
jgi:hypothetical protein